MKSDEEPLSIKSIVLTYDLDGDKPLYQVDLMFSSTLDAYKMAYDFMDYQTMPIKAMCSMSGISANPITLSDVWISLSANTLVIRALEPNTIWEERIRKFSDK